MKTQILIQIIEWGAMLLFMIVGFICICTFNRKDEDESFSILGGFVFLIMMSYLPAIELYDAVNKYYLMPDPSNEIEVCIDGETRIQYQDITHLCHAFDENSTVFTSYKSIDGEVSQSDTCIICLRPFLCHETRSEWDDFITTTNALTLMMNQ